MKKLKLYPNPNGIPVIDAFGRWQSHRLRVRLIAKYGIHDRKRGSILLPYGTAINVGRRLEYWLNDHDSSRTKKRASKVHYLIMQIYKNAGCMIEITSDNKLILIKDVSSHEYCQFMTRQGLDERRLAKFTVRDYLSYSIERWQRYKEYVFYYSDEMLTPMPVKSSNATPTKLPNRIQAVKKSSLTLH